MSSFPHRYAAQAKVTTEATVMVASQGLPSIVTAPPVEFGGPGDQWSPETLLMASVVDCFVLSFRAIAQVSQLAWISLDCRGEGVLDQVERAICFTEITINATLHIPAETDNTKARRLLEKAKQTCFITNSLRAESKLEVVLKNN